MFTTRSVRNFVKLGRSSVVITVTVMLLTSCEVSETPETKSGPADTRDVLFGDFRKGMTIDEIKSVAPEAVESSGQFAGMEIDEYKVGGHNFSILLDFDYSDETTPILEEVSLFKKLERPGCYYFKEDISDLMEGLVQKYGKPLRVVEGPDEFFKYNFEAKWQYGRTDIIMSATCLDEKFDLLLSINYGTSLAEKAERL